MQAAKIEADQLELYKCYSSKSTQERAAELPIDLSGMWKYHRRENNQKVSTHHAVPLHKIPYDYS